MAGPGGAALTSVRQGGAVGPRRGFVRTTVTLTLRTQDFRVLTRRKAPQTPTQTARTLFAISRALLREELRGEAYRPIGVGLSDLGPESAAADLFAGAETKALREETTIDGLRRRFGQDVVVKGRSLRP